MRLRVILGILDGVSCYPIIFGGWGWGYEERELGQRAWLGACRDRRMSLYGDEVGFLEGYPWIVYCRVFQDLFAGKLFLLLCELEGMWFTLLLIGSKKRSQHTINLQFPNRPHLLRHVRMLQAFGCSSQQCLGPV